MSFTPEALSTGQQRSLNELKGRGKKRLGLILLGLLLVIGASFVYCSFTASARFPQYVQLRSLVIAADPNTQQLVLGADGYHEWFKRHGTTYEFHTFNAIVTTVYSLIVSISGIEPASPAPVHSILLMLSGVIVRTSFLFFACLRIWALAVVLGIVVKIWNFKPHRGNDFLGITGNGRFYYSGIRAALDTVADDGAPDIHVRGLICLPELSAVEVDKSKAAAVLKKYHALNATNKELLGIILAHPNYPAYLEIETGISAIEEAYTDEGLIVQTTHLLSEMLALYVETDSGANPESAANDPAGEALVPALSTGKGRVGPQVYAQIVARVAARVLTPSLKKSLTETDPVHLATVILAIQAGKCLGYAKVGPSWVQKTSFLQLSARAVLHSTANYGSEYSYHERALIRQALIYASRRSVFGPVALPVDITRPVQSLRSWAELLIASPQDIETVANRVELYCLCWELEKRFRQGFLSGFQDGKPEVVEGVYYSQQDMLFVPLKNVLRILLQVVPTEVIDRMAQLTAAVSKADRGGQIFVAEDQEGDAQIPPYMKVLAPLTKEEVATLVADHELTAKDVQRWDPLRMVLFSYSWLGRQIGHVAVPDSSIVYAVMKSNEKIAGANRLGLLGISGVVPIRGSKLREQLSAGWRRHCVAVHSVAIADRKSDFEALLNGKDVKGSEDLGSTRTLAV